MAYLEDGHCRPEDVIKVLSVTLTLGVVRDDLGTRAIALVAIVLHELAKLTPEQIHAQNTAPGRWEMKEKHNAMRTRSVTGMSTLLPWS